MSSPTWPASVRRQILRSATCGVMALSMMACHGLLDTTDPTLIRDDDIANVAGANGRRLAAAVQFHGAFSTFPKDVALFTDEMGLDGYAQYIANDENYGLDTRNDEIYLRNHGGAFDDPYLGLLDWTLTTSALAIPQIRLYSPDSLKGDYLAQMYAYRGYMIVQMAEDVCPGFPINEVTPDNQPLLSMPYSTDSALSYGISQLDSAIKLVKDSTSYLYLASVAKGRALLDLGKYTEAAAAIQNVPDDFIYLTNPNGYTPFYTCPGCTWDGTGYPIGDGEGINGLHFVSEHDVIRSPTRYVQQNLQDSTRPLYTSDKYSSEQAQMVVASGQEARLMDAEIALHQNAEDGVWLAKLNALRIPVGLDSLHDPGTDTARVSLVYHERAFWMFLTGRRLGDMRRLIRIYGRNPEKVFPTGNHAVSGSYSNATAIPFNFPGESLYNFNLKTGCTTP